MYRFRLIFYVCFSSLILNAQCQIEKISGSFLFEISPELSGEDDMIYRNPVLISKNQKKPNIPNF
jgi:hypothetical protein